MTQTIETLNERLSQAEKQICYLITRVQRLEDEGSQE